MKYQGKITDIKGRILTVEIITDGDSSVVTDFSECGLLFAPYEALMITGETEDVFSVIISQRATIKFLAEDFISDFYRSDVREAKVKILLEDTIIFDGFILPQTYSQGYASRFDELEINCIDRLSALQYIRWRNIGEADIDYETLKNESGELSLAEIISLVLSMTGSSEYEAIGYPRLEQGGISALQGIKINERIFFGEDEDEVWTSFKVLEECLRYLNLHITQNGDNVIIFNWEDLKNCDLCEINTDNCFGTDTNFSIHETFSRIELTCKTQERDQLMEDPLDLDSCSSPYVSRTGYCTEYSMMTKEDEDHAYFVGLGLNPHQTAFYSIINGSEPGDVYDDEVWRRDWWVRVLENPRWRFYSFSEGRTWNGEIPYNYTQQQSYEYYPTRVAGGKYENRVPDNLAYTMGSCLLQTYTGKTSYKTEDNERQTAIDENKYLIVGVGGTGGEVQEEGSSQTAYAVQTLKRRSGTPVAVFSGGSHYLSPSDAATTRYLDISGSICLAPYIPAYKTPQFFSDLASGAPPQPSLFDSGGW